MRPNLLLVLLAMILLASCGAFPEGSLETSLPPSPVMEQPTTPVPKIPPTGTPSDPNFFRDDFNITLEDGWQWLREDPSQWSLTAVPGSLRLNALIGEITKESLPNVLLRPAPQGDYQIEVKLTFQPVTNFQFAGIVVYESPTNLIQVGRAFCDLPTTCVGDGLYIDYYKDGEFVFPNFAREYTEGATMYLRLVHQADTYTLQVSPDGASWFLRGGQVSEMTPASVGLAAGQNLGEPVSALFDYFEIKSLDQ